MVFVAVAIGAGWLYSVGVTLTGGGEVFFRLAVAAHWISISMNSTSVTRAGAAAEIFR